MHGHRWRKGVAKAGVVVMASIALVGALGVNVVAAPNGDAAVVSAAKQQVAAGAEEESKFLDAKSKPNVVDKLDCFIYPCWYEGKAVEINGELYTHTIHAKKMGDGEVNWIEYNLSASCFGRSS